MNLEFEWRVEASVFDINEIFDLHGKYSTVKLNACSV